MYLWYTLKMCTREKEMDFHNTYWQNHWRPQIGLFSNWFHEGIKRHWVIPLHCVGMCLVLLHYSCLCMEGFSFLRWQWLWLIGLRGTSVCVTARVFGRTFREYLYLEFKHLKLVAWKLLFNVRLVGDLYYVMSLNVVEIIGKRWV